MCSLRNDGRSIWVVYVSVYEVCVRDINRKWNAILMRCVAVLYLCEEHHKQMSPKCFWVRHSLVELCLWVQIYIFPFNRNINDKTMKTVLLIGCIVQNARRVHCTPHKHSHRYWLVLKLACTLHRQWEIRRQIYTTIDRFLSALVANYNFRFMLYAFIINSEHTLINYVRCIWIARQQLLLSPKLASSVFFRYNIGKSFLPTGVKFNG